MKWLLCSVALAAVCGCARTVEHGLEGRIARHSFWRVPVSEAQVHDLATQAVQLQARDVVYVDQQFHVSLVKNTTDDRLVFDSYREMGLAPTTPPGLTPPLVYVDMKQFGTRPDRATFLEVLLQRLDAADFARSSR